MKRALIPVMILTASSCVFAQESWKRGFLSKPGRWTRDDAWRRYDRKRARRSCAGRAVFRHDYQRKYSDPRRRNSHRANHHRKHCARFAGPNAPGRVLAAHRKSIRRRCAAHRFHPGPRRADSLHAEFDGQDGDENACASPEHKHFRPSGRPRQGPDANGNSHA